MVFLYFLVFEDVVSCRISAFDIHLIGHLFAEDLHYDCSLSGVHIGFHEDE